jgi:hypothetical protein
VKTLNKPDLGNGVSHPARFSKELLPLFADILTRHNCKSVLDPFAGTGKIHELREQGFETWGTEIEREWANLNPYTIHANVLTLLWTPETYDAICTSPCYGNRLADHHNASDPQSRRSYTHDLGRPLHPDNAGAMHWGLEYRDFHRKAWAIVLPALKFGGIFILNIKDHIRNGEIQPVTLWHFGELLNQPGMTLVESHEVDTPSLKVGANRDSRLKENVLVFKKLGKGYTLASMHSR